MKLSELLKQGYGDEIDLNCAEKMLYGANKVYDLGLDDSSLKMSAGFGGGIGMESVCGVLTGGVMVLGTLFVANRAHESDRIKLLTREFFESYEKEMGSTVCKPLKGMHRTEELKCKNVIVKAAEILETIIDRELKN